MNNIEIERLIMAKLLTYPNLDLTRVQRENFNFTTPLSGMWIKASVKPSTSFMSGMADKPCTREIGIFYIQIFNKENNGTGKQKAYADNLANHFEYYKIDKLELLTPTLVDVGFDSTVNAYQMNLQVPYRYN